MTETCNSEPCPTNPCATTSGGSEECNMPEKLIQLADEAWEELLKDKLKAHIQAQKGKKLDDLAKLVAEANDARWKHLIQGKLKCEEFKTRLKSLLAENVGD